MGSGNDLYRRLSNYYQPWYFSSRPNILILRAMVKYGMINFTALQPPSAAAAASGALVILEITDSDSLLNCEQKWIDELKPI